MLPLCAVHELLSMSDHMVQKTQPFNLPWQIKEVASLMEIVKKTERNIKKMIILQLTSQIKWVGDLQFNACSSSSLFVQIRGATHFYITSFSYHVYNKNKQQLAYWKQNLVYEYILALSWVSYICGSWRFPCVDEGPLADARN